MPLRLGSDSRRSKREFLQCLQERLPALTLGHVAIDDVQCACGQRRIARKQNNGHITFVFFDAMSQLRALHVRHVIVEDDKIEAGIGC